MAEEEVTDRMSELAVEDNQDSSPTSESPATDANKDDVKDDASSGTASPAVQNKSRIDILLKATGDAPIMKKRKWAVDKSKKVGWIIEFIRRYLKLEPQDSLFLYVNQSFAPSPDVLVGTVYECFGADNKLVLHYCRTQAWG